MQRLEVSGAVRPIFGSLGVKRLILAADDSCTVTTVYAVQCVMCNLSVRLASDLSDFWLFPTSDIGCLYTEAFGIHRSYNPLATDPAH